MPRVIPALFALALLAAPLARAVDAVPMIVTSEGYLLDSLDHPVTATLDVTFGIYDDSEPSHAPTPLWSETYSVQVANGHFAVVLGDTLPRR